MSQNFFHRTALKILKVAASVSASVTVLSAIASSPAHAAEFYRSTFSVFSNTPAPFTNPLSTATVDFTKTGLSNGLTGYEVTNANLTVTSPLAQLLGVPSSYTLAQLRSSSRARTLALALNTLAAPPKYQGILPNVLANRPAFDYIGDGDFPPVGTFSYTFPGLAPSQVPASNSTLAALASLFRNGGRVTVSSQRMGATAPQARVAALESAVDLPTLSAPTASEAVPEPTTMAGLALAGASMAIARRKHQQKDAA